MGVCNTHYGQILAVLILDDKKSLHSLVKEGLCVRRDLESVCESPLEYQTVTQIKLGVLGVTLSITFRGSSLASRDSWKFLCGPRPAPQLTCISSLHRVFCRTEDLGPVLVNMLPQGRSRDIAKIYDQLCFDAFHLEWRASLWGFFCC